MREIVCERHFCDLLPCKAPSDYEMSWDRVMGEGERRLLMRMEWDEARIRDGRVGFGRKS